MTMSLVASILLKITITTVLALASTRLTRRGRASVRHLVLAAAFGVLAVLPVASTFAPTVRVAMPIAMQEVIGPLTMAPIVDDVGPGASVGTALISTARPPSSWPSLSTVLQAVWITGTVVCLWPVILGLFQVRAMRRFARPWPDGHAIVDTMAGEARIRRPIEVLMHTSLPGPMTCGVVHPAIVVPADVCSWPEEDLRRAIVHELEHVRRGDWVSQCLARTVCACYWFHPLVWMAWRQLALEAERACDDAVLRRSEATAYADQLVVLAERLSTPSNQPQLAMASRADLATRVVAVLDSQQRRGRAGVLVVAVVSVASALLIATMSPVRIVAVSRSGSAQASTGRPTFDVVSIKPCAPGEGGGRRGGTSLDASPGRINFQCMTVVDLIARAYVQFGDPPPLNNVKFDSQMITGGPAWARSDRYTIEAKAEGTPARTTMTGAMLRALLEDRLQLKIHEDFREVPAYALTVAKSGFKLRPVPEESCTPHDPTAPLALPPGGGKPVGDDGKPFCVGGVGRHGPNLTYDVTGQNLDRISRTLGALVLDRPVVNQTGMTGLFTFRVEFANDENRLTLPGEAPSDVPAGPSIFTAFEKDLGLKLVPSKAQQGFLVIDRVERPSNAPAAMSPRSAVPSTLATQTAASATSQRFDAASIKPCAPEQQLPGRGRGAAGGTNASASPGRFYVPCVTLEQLIYLAYASYGARDDEHLANDYFGAGSDDKKVRGGPAWVHSYKDKYAIEATAPGVSERLTLMGTMLRTLLEERFQLEIHRESENVPMYALRVAKSGFKLKPMNEGDCDKDAAGAPPASWTKQPCGFMTNSGGTFSRWHYVGFELSFLARQLSGPVGRHVIDETGVTGKFIIDLAFESDEIPAPAAGDSAAVQVPGAGASIFTALEHQLGLKLEKTTGPQGYIVVDHVERPER